MLMLTFLSVALTTQASPPATPEPAPPPARVDCTAPEHRQFDFWLGDWDVVPSNAAADADQPPARNTVTSAHGGCVLIENWQTDVMTGQSLNVYDRSRGEWHQTWVDSRGGLHEYWGTLHGDRMVLFGSTPVPSSPTFRMRVRLTFFDLGDGRVRQLSERLNADGTWSVNYDLLYTRRP